MPLKAGAPTTLTNGGVEISLAGERLHLLPERAAYLPEYQTLLVADAHIGKASSFRRLGVPVPAGTTASTLQRLSQAVQRCQARQLVFLGDLVHSEHAAAPATWAAVARWREQHPALVCSLLRGNHDLRAGDPPADWRIHCLSGTMPLGALTLSHHPDAWPHRYVLAGHIHPGVVLRGRAPDRLRLPCFHFGEAVGVLPAFGEFTGLHIVRPAPGDRLYAIAEDEVVALP